jgi:hypothetical protein
MALFAEQSIFSKAFELALFVPCLNAGFDARKIRWRTELPDKASENGNGVSVVRSIAIAVEVCESNVAMGLMSVYLGHLLFQHLQDVVDHIGRQLCLPSAGYISHQ